jgi:hypothetical protein
MKKLHVEIEMETEKNDRLIQMFIGNLSKSKINSFNSKLLAYYRLFEKLDFLTFPIKINRW